MIKVLSKGLIYRINKIFAICIVIWVCWPWLGQNTGLIGGIFFASTWCITAFLIEPVRFITKDDILLLIYAAIMMFSYLFYGKVYGTFPLYYYISMIMLFFLPFYIFKFYIKQKDLKFLGMIALVSIIFMMVGAITSSYYTYIDPNIMKTISQNLDTEFLLYRKVGIGSFGFIYMVMFMVIAVVAELKCRYKKSSLFVKVILLSFCILGIKCLIDSTFTTALILSFVGIILVLLTREKYFQRNVLVYIATFIMCVFLSQIIGNLLVNIELESSDVTTRMREIGNIFLGNGGGENTDSRFAYFMKSLECFFNYPLLGYNYVSFPKYAIGGHSEWMDILAVYGLIGGIPVIATIVMKIKYVAKYTKNKINYSFYGIIIFIFFIFGFIDPFLRLYNIGFALFLLVPSVGCITISKRKEEDNSNWCL